MCALCCCVLPQAARRVRGEKSAAFASTHEYRRMRTANTKRLYDMSDGMSHLCVNCDRRACVCLLLDSFTFLIHTRCRSWPPVTICRQVDKWDYLNPYIFQSNSIFVFGICASLYRFVVAGVLWHSDACLATNHRRTSVFLRKMWKTQSSEAARLTAIPTLVISTRPPHRCNAVKTKQHCPIFRSVFAFCQRVFMHISFSTISCVFTFRARNHGKPVAMQRSDGIASITGNQLFSAVVLYRLCASSANRDDDNDDRGGDGDDSGGGRCQKGTIALCVYLE